MKTAILIGGGGSVKEGVDLGLWDKIKGKDIWSLNFAFMTMPYFPNRQCWIDVSFFKNNIDQLQRLYINGVSCYTKLHQKYSGIPEIKCYETTRDPTETNKLFIGRMGLTGFFTLSLAIKENYDLIYLLGYDFGSITNNNFTHYYQDRIKILSTGVGRPELYVKGTETKKEVSDFELFTKSNSKIINVSPLSRIPYFDKIDYPTFFERIKNE